MVQTTEVVYKISKENIEEAILNFLFSMNLVPRDLDVLNISVPLVTDHKGHVTVVMDVVE